MIQPGDSDEMIKEKLIGVVLFFVGAAIGGYFGAGKYMPITGLVTSLGYFVLVIWRARAAIAKPQEERK